MNKNITTLLTAGCSFTEGTTKWPVWVARHLDIKLHNHGQISASNGYISRSLIYHVDKLLPDIDSSELLVGVMWSGCTRHENFVSDTSRFEKKFKYNFVDTGAWVRLNHNELDSYSTPYYRKYYDFMSSYIQTLEHILRTQWFLEKHNIKYFMTCYSYDVLPEPEYRDNPNIKHLYNMVDFSKFLPVDNCMDWCHKSGIPGHAPDEGIRALWKSSANKFLNSCATHPNTDQYRGFAEQIVVPYIKTHFLI